jgi:hypothetical protein
MNPEKSPAPTGIAKDYHVPVAVLTPQNSWSVSSINIYRALKFSGRE